MYYCSPTLRYIMFYFMLNKLNLGGVTQIFIYREELAVASNQEFTVQHLYFSLFHPKNGF
jgi:hypothetical protein